MPTIQRGHAWVLLGFGLVLGYAAAALDMPARLPSWAAPAANRLEQQDPSAAPVVQMDAVLPLAVSPRKPNIVFLMADNLGYGEVGCYGGGILRGAPTPRIDQLAGEGLRLLNFNVEAQCTPS